MARWGLIFAGGRDGDAAGGGRPPWVTLRAGDVLELDGVALRVLHPAASVEPGGEPNASSLVLLVRYGAFTALLTGDAPAAVEEAVAGEAGDIDVLKVAHHGSRTSSSADFLAVVRPEAALVSAGRRNRFGHPHADVVARLREGGSRVHRTDLSGDLRVVARRDGGWHLVGGVGGSGGALARWLRGAR